MQTVAAVSLEMSSPVCSVITTYQELFGAGGNGDGPGAHASSSEAVLQR